jgi:hypothetical protein
LSLKKARWCPEATSSSSFRAAYGLKTNPDLGRQLDVTGILGAYFAHAGLTAPPPTTTAPTTTPPGDYDSTYYTRSATQGSR